MLLFVNEEEHILRCLGAAVIMQWNDLPTKMKRELFEHASSMGELNHTAELKGQVARFLHQAPRAAIIVDPLLILDDVGGYHVLLAGMEQISVDLGQFVVTGEPVAVMGGRAQSAVAKAGGASQPVLYVEFRKDGIGQKVRG